MRAERLDIRADEIVEELARIAFSNLGDYVDWDAHEYGLSRGLVYFGATFQRVGIAGSVVAACRRLPSRHRRAPDAHSGSPCAPFGNAVGQAPYGKTSFALTSQSGVTALLIGVVVPGIHACGRLRYRRRTGFSR